MKTQQPRAIAEAKLVQAGLPPEQLISIEGVALRLDVSKRTAQRLARRLEAQGLQRVRVGSQTVRYRQASLDRMIRRAAERGEALL